MALTEQTVDEHILHWSETLKRSRYPLTSKWPARIFRHDPIENIAQILNTGTMLSRNDSAGEMAVDAAESAIVHATGRAHANVRMYFRPRTPTQYRMEGIRKREDMYGDAHSPTLGMMVFDAKTLLTRDGCSFSSCNMQSPQAEVGDSDNFFLRAMDFEKTFHHGPHTMGEEITRRRCAEVLLPSPLSIDPLLRGIYCRSNAEREMLVNLLDPQIAVQWTNRIRVSEDMMLFQRDYTYVESVSISGKGLHFQLAPRRDNQDVNVQIFVRDNRGDLILSYAKSQFRPRPPSNAKQWILKRKFLPGRYLVTIELENFTAYENEIDYAETPF